MDGVIVDTEPLHHKAYFKMFETVGIDISEKHYQSFTGQSTINVCKKLKEEFSLSQTAEEIKNIKQSIFKDIFKHDKDLKLIDGVHELIVDYYNNGLSLILASSASHNTINNVFTRFDLDRFFIHKISGADFEKSKPHPAIFNRAAELSGHSKSNCVVIEDSTNGIQAANAAEIFCVGFMSPHSKNQDYSKADKIIKSFDEINYNKLKTIFNT